VSILGTKRQEYSQTSWKSEGEKRYSMRKSEQSGVIRKVKEGDGTWKSLIDTFLAILFRCPN
jgi:hypothetical protein